MKTLISVGCSFAFGQGLEDPTQSYAHILANKYNRRLFDYSRAGCSNEYIASACAAAVKTVLMHSKPEDVVVIVGWTEQARLTIFDTEYGDILSAFPHLNRPRNPVDRIINKYAWHESFGVYKLFHAYNYVNMICRAYGIKCIHLASMDAIMVSFPNSTVKSDRSKQDTRVLFDIFDHVDRTEIQKLFNYKDSFLYLIKSDPERFLLQKDDTHPNAEAHRVWADRISENYGDILGA